MELTRPPLKFAVTIDGEEREVNMSYGLFRELAALFPNPENIGELLVTDPGLRDFVVRRVLTDKKKIEKEEDLIDLDEAEIDLDVVDDLVVWVGDHILYFFTTSMKKVVGLGEKYQETIHQLAQSKIGSQDSDSKEASVGPSTAANPT